MTKSWFSSRKYFRSLTKNIGNDPWVGIHSPIEPEKLHAIGLVQFEWVACEYNLFSLFCTISGWKEKEAWIAVHNQGDNSIIEKIKAMMELKKFSDLDKKAVQSALLFYNSCRINRNSLTHFVISSGGAENVGLRLRRSSRNPKAMFGGEMFDDIWSIRLVVRDLRRLRRHLEALWLYLHMKKVGKTATAPAQLPAPRVLWPSDAPRREA